MKPTKDQIKQYWSQALRRSLDAYTELSDREWGRKAASHWTAKDVLAHMVMGQEELSNVLIRKNLAGEPVSIDGWNERSDIDDFNARQLERVRDLPVPELLARLKASYDEALAILDGLSEADLDKPATHPGWDRPGTIRDLFFGAYLHLPGHYQDIRRAAKSKLPHWTEAVTPEEVHFHMDRIFHIMPLIFRSDRGADMKATYAFNMEGEGGGQWALHIADGKAESQDGKPDEFDIEIKTKPQLWIDLANNDLNPVWAITTRKVQLGGNASLAMKLGTLFQVSE